MRVGFIGIGNMGWPMAANIAKAGHDLAVFDLDAERSARFAYEHGARVASSLAEIAHSEAAITMLPTGQIVRRALIEQEDGAFAKSLRPGALVIDMSSSEPVGTRELGKALEGLGGLFGNAGADVPRSRSVPAGEPPEALPGPDGNGSITRLPL